MSLDDERFVIAGTGQRGVAVSRGNKTFVVVVTEPPNAPSGLAVDASPSVMDFQADAFQTGAFQ